MKPVIRVNKFVFSRYVAATILFALVACSGCASRYVQAAVRNETGGTVTLVEVDYPSASFGKETLSSGDEYKYRFKILGSGETKVSWIDAGQHQHQVTGPKLDEGQQGSLIVTLTPIAASWDVQLR